MSDPRTYTPAFTPHGNIIAALSNIDLLKLIEIARAEVPVRRDGSVKYESWANAIKSSVRS